MNKNWIKDNYDLVVLTVAGILAVVLLLGVFTADDKVKKITSQPEPQPRQGYDMTEQKAALTGLEKSIDAKHELADAGRLRLFNSIKLYLKKGESSVVDIEGGQPLHEPIPNEWWNQHGLADKDFLAVDALTRDADSDGFSNLEEFNAGTNPADADKHPSLALKLQLKEMKSSSVELSWREAGSDGKANFRIKSEKLLPNGRTKSSSDPFNSLTIGSKFPTKGDMANRFEIKSRTADAAENNPNSYEKGDYFVLIDHAMGGKEIKLRYAEKLKINDWVAVFELNTPGEAGKKILVAEGDSFALPYDQNASKKPFRFAKQEGGKEVFVDYKNLEGKQQQLQLKL